MKKKEYTTKEFTGILKKNGFELTHYKGSHAVYKKDGKIVVVPVTSKQINRMMTRRLIIENNLQV